MRTPHDAVALAERERDKFYPTAFMIEAWLGDLTLRFSAEYAEKKNAAERRLQCGQAIEAAQEVFPLASLPESLRLHHSLCRYAEYDDVYADILARVLIACGIEHEVTGNPLASIPPGNISALQEAQSTQFKRLCEWIDAFMHLRTHCFFHLSPVSFDVDPEKRELASLGINQRQFPHLDAYRKAWWNWHHSEAAERFQGSAKWKHIGEAAASDAQRTWTHPEVDIIGIAFWPLVTRYNWTYADLMGLVRELLPSYRQTSIYKDVPPVYRSPLDCDTGFTSHCNNVLGLRKGGRGTSAPSGTPQGYAIGLKLAPYLS